MPLKEISAFFLKLLNNSSFGILKKCRGSIANTLIHIIGFKSNNMDQQAKLGHFRSASPSTAIIVSKVKVSTRIAEFRKGTSSDKSCLHHEPRANCRWITKRCPINKKLKLIFCLIILIINCIINTQFDKCVTINVLESILKNLTKVEKKALSDVQKVLIRKYNDNLLLS